MARTKKTKELHVKPRLRPDPMETLQAAKDALDEYEKRRNALVDELAAAFDAVLPRSIELCGYVLPRKGTPGNLGVDYDTACTAIRALEVSGLVRNGNIEFHVQHRATFGYGSTPEEAYRSFLRSAKTRGARDALENRSAEAAAGAHEQNSIANSLNYILNELEKTK